MRTTAAHGRAEADLSRARVIRRGPGRDVRLTLRALRESSGKTQAQIAKRSGLAQPDISKLETATTLDDRMVATLRRYLSAIGDDLELVATSKFGHRIGLAGSSDAVAPQSDPEDYEALLAAGRRQKQRETPLPGTEPRWLGHVRAAYQKLGQHLDILSSSDEFDPVRRAEAQAELHKLHKAFGRKVTVKRAQIFDIMLAIAQAATLKKSAGPLGPRYGAPDREKAQYACDSLRWIDPEVHALAEKDMARYEDPARLVDYGWEPPRIASVIDQWVDDTPRSKKWPLLRELLQYLLPGADIPKAASLGVMYRSRYKKR
jgi:transcriptional regulator with XRE-family HTH domain